MLSNPGSKAFKKNFTLQEKYNIILQYENESSPVKELQAKFGCGKTQIYRMIKRREEIKEEFLCGTNNPKTKRFVKFTPNNEINNKVLEWYREAKRRGESVNGVSLKLYARELSETLGIKDFKASNGWLQSFQYRNNISFSTNKSSRSSEGNRPSASPVQPKEDPLDTDNDDIVEVLEEAPIDNDFEISESMDVQELDKSSQLSLINNSDICTVCETVLYYNTLPDDRIGKHTDQLTILFCYYNDGQYEKPLITLHEANYSMVRRQFFNHFIFKKNSTGLLTFQYLVEYLTILNTKLEGNERHIALRLDEKFNKFVFGSFSNIELVFEATLNHGGAEIITDFKLNYRNLLLNGYIPFACNSSKLTFSKYFDLNDAIKLIWKSIGIVDFGAGCGDGMISTNLRSVLYDKMVICKFNNLNIDDYLNIDMVDIVYYDGVYEQEVGESEDEDAVISLSKATLYLIEIKKMLMKRGGDERFIDKVDELQNDLNEMCFEEKRLNLI